MSRDKRKLRRWRKKKHTAFMDKIDFEEHLDRDPQGIKIFPTKDDAFQHQPCCKGCGVVQIQIKFVEVVHETNPKRIMSKET